MKSERLETTKDTKSTKRKAGTAWFYLRSRSHSVGACLQANRLRHSPASRLLHTPSSWSFWPGWGRFDKTPAPQARAGF